MKRIVFVESNTSGHGLRAIGVAKQMGLAVDFLAANPDLFRNGGQDPLQDVDRLILTDTYDVEEMLKVVDHENTIGVVAWDDYHLVPASELAQRLGLIHPSIDGLNGARYKDQTRLRLQAQGEMHPQFVIASELEDYTDSPVGYPCVVKPVDDSGSVGVKICQNKSEFLEAMKVLHTRITNVRGYELSRRWLIEEYMEGNEFSAELLYHGGEWHLLGVTKKLLTPPPYCVEVGHLFPAPMPETTYDLVKEKIFSWVHSVGLTSGALHVEFRLTDNGPALIEINPRLGGDMIPELIRLVYGFDVVEYLLKVAIGEEGDLDLKSLQPNGAAAIYFLVPEKNGLIHEIQGSETIKSLSFVTDCQFKAGQIQVQAATSSYDRLGHIIVKGPSSEEAENNIYKAIQNINYVWGALV